ncbi:glucose 1-dehydrogenase [Chryseolinea sp. H1M3-3]|uniref:SDR family NAD(P)-dependent oxidoreductase n=1 Tax=Chryseolinea sp. H1M3-3 TaxID=3034144 RepID=UPI0023EDF51B|nr:glucose 1-dehydrogenase [Chryseolinea sp. H1M3-3]
MRFKNKIALVTGGGRDIGRAISMKLASEGAKVIINYNLSKDETQITADTITAAKGEAVIFKADLTKADEVQSLKRFCEKTYGGKIDILINNAGGIVGRKKLSEQDEDFYDTVMDLNFKSLFLVTHAFYVIIPAGGSIVNVSSQAARDGGGAGASLYAASKGAITTYTRSLAKELGPSGIRVNAVCPGLISTTFHDKFTAADVRQKVVAATPLRREGTSEDVANLVAFLASDESSFITGANYDINGGTGLY